MQNWAGQVGWTWSVPIAHGQKKRPGAENLTRAAKKSQTFQIARLGDGKMVS
jgi:hypothetical protein